MKPLTAKDPGGNPLLDYEYTYDNMVGNIQSKATEHGNYAYGYDDSSRLTSADKPTLDDEAYTYDTVGNRLTTGVFGNWNYNANNELLGFADVEYVYDENGNMIQKKVDTVAVNYVYNHESRLIRVEDELTKVVIAEYYYDPFGRRLWKEVGGTKTYFFYSDKGLIGEHDANGNTLTTYGYKPDSTWTTDPLFLKQGLEYYFYQNDHLGTPQKLTAMNGAVVWSATYTVFGDAVVDVPTVTNNLRFPGQYYDAEMELHYNFQRYYKPEDGKYLRTDPIRFLKREVNLYRYSKNNPVILVDPKGLTHRSGIETRLDYSCNCGWIDWSHANPGTVDRSWLLQLWNPPRGILSGKGWAKSKTGNGFLIVAGQTIYELDQEVFLYVGNYYIKDAN